MPFYSHFRLYTFLYNLKYSPRKANLGYQQDLRFPYVVTVSGPVCSPQEDLPYSRWLVRWKSNIIAR